MTEIKNERDYKLFFQMHPILQLIVMDGANWAFENGLNYVITETVTTLEDDLKANRKTKTHRTKRACDVRSASWPKWARKAFINYLTEKYGEYAAVNTEGVKILVKDHDSGSGDHFHIQIHWKYAL